MKVIGVMSGTSVDGIDLALCEIEGAPPQLSAKILDGVTVSYVASLKSAIFEACRPGKVDDLARLNMAIGEAIASAIVDFVPNLEMVDLIASHGQTVWHDVDEVGAVRATLQIGEAAMIAERTGITTISNFRARDVSAGGQGAPLTAYVDWLLMRHPEGWRAVQNMGGMGNVSFLPPLNDDHSSLIAFDTGPGNVLIDSAMRIITHGEHDYDEGGKFAASGWVSETWLDDLLKHPYFLQEPPRTTGRETFSASMAARLLAEGQGLGLSQADVVATLTALTAASIANAYRDFAPEMPQQIILGGGGAHNLTLRRMIENFLPNASVLVHEDVGLDSDFKEALVFAVLGYETWHAREGTLPSQTGARHGSVLGDITPAKNYVDLIRKTWCI